MSSLGQPGSSNHSHPGLSFPQVGGIRRPYHPPTPPTKPSATPSYQAQQYTPQQPPPQAYSHRLYSNTTSSPVPTVASVAGLSNGPSRHAVQATQHAQAAVQAARHHQQHQHQRGNQQRQAPSQPASSSMTYLQQSLNNQSVQQVPQQVQVTQQVSQTVPQIQHSQTTQQVQQPVKPVQLVQPAQPAQNQPASQAQQQHQQQHEQQQHQQLLQQKQQHHQQQIQVQANGSASISQSQPLHQQHAQSRTQPQPIQTAHPQTHRQVQQQQQQQQPMPPQQPTPRSQTQQLPAARSEPAVASQNPQQHGDEMEVDSPGDSGEGESHMTTRMLDGVPFVPRSPMGAMMSAPPQGGSFANLEAIHRHVLEYCTSVGFAVVIGRSKKTVPGLKKVLFVCDRAGKPPSRISPEKRQRKTSSRKCDCPFGFFAIEQRTQWTIRYRPDPVHLRHNHGPSESPLLHPAARKLDSSMVAAVKSLKESGVGVSQTLEILQAKHPHVPLLPRDIYNARAAINRNPQKVEAGITEQPPAIYRKPPPTAEERIRSDLRKELARTKDELAKFKEQSKKQIEELQETIRQKDKEIEKFEMFIDICNQRVMVQRERLSSDNDATTAGTNK